MDREAKRFIQSHLWEQTDRFYDKRKQKEKTEWIIHDLLRDIDFGGFEKGKDILILRSYIFIQRLRNGTAKGSYTKKVEGNINDEDVYLVLCLLDSAVTLLNEIEDLRVKYQEVYISARDDELSEPDSDLESVKEWEDQVFILQEGTYEEIFNILKGAIKKRKLTPFQQAFAREYMPEDSGRQKGKKLRALKEKLTKISEIMDVPKEKIMQTEYYERRSRGPLILTFKETIVKNYRRTNEVGLEYFAVAEIDEKNDTYFIWHSESELISMLEEIAVYNHMKVKDLCLANEIYWKSSDKGKYCIMKSQLYENILGWFKFVRTKFERTEENEKKYFIWKNINELWPVLRVIAEPSHLRVDELCFLNDWEWKKSETKDDPSLKMDMKTFDQIIETYTNIRTHKKK